MFQKTWFSNVVCSLIKHFFPIILYPLSSHWKVFLTAGHITTQMCSLVAMVIFDQSPLCIYCGFPHGFARPFNFEFPRTIPCYSLCMLHYVLRAFHHALLYVFHTNQFRHDYSLFPPVHSITSSVHSCLTLCVSY